MRRHHGTQGFPDLEALCRRGVQRSGRFGRMFPDLPPLYIDPQELKELGKPGGAMDGGIKGSRTKTVPIAHVFFGQFIDHDITLDVSSSFSALNEPGAIDNLRTPTLDLDNVFGEGPDAEPFMYVNSGDLSGVALLTGADGVHPSGQPVALADDDLPRVETGRAIIGDPRNDENRIISQLQLAFLRYHNWVAKKVKVARPELSGGALFVEARRVSTWHYQWVVVNDFLPTMVGRPLVEDILSNGRKFFPPPSHGAEGPFIPVEFSVAAYRFGHSMISQTVTIKSGGSALDLFGPVLGAGFKALATADGVVDWNQLVAADPTVSPERAEPLDAKLASTLLALPFITDGTPSLATRNLLRGQSFLLPSGEQVARLMGRDQGEIKKVTATAQSLAKKSGVSLDGGTPLWFYILVEGQEIGRETEIGNYDQGEGLGPVGGRIVAEVILGLLELDRRSYLGSDRSWYPGNPKDGLGITSLFELLTVPTP